MNDLKTPVSRLGQFGAVLSKRLKKLGIETVEDLIFYFPFRHEDFSNLVPISGVASDSSATIKGKIDLIANRRSWKRRTILTEALISDDTGSIKAIWFNQSFLTRVLRPGDRVFLSGKIEYDRHSLQFINPIYEIARGDELVGVHTARIVPIYPLTSSITQKQIRMLVKIALNSVKLIKDWLPKETKNKWRLMDLATALFQIHFPDDKKKLDSARHRLKFDELFLFQLQARRLRQELDASPAVKIPFKQEKIKKFVDSLPFKLTNAQRVAAWEIIKDLERGRPMNRLVEGDVGSGKTVVATIAALHTVLDGHSVVFLAPTEILARQHFGTISRILKGWPISVGLLTRSESKIMDGLGSRNFTKAEMLKKISEGDIQIMVGTHALLQEKVKFCDLALLIVDEQHRFGVEQRKNLKEKNKNNGFVLHLLSMTATPIPRTLALAFYGDLNLSIIDEMPEGRKKIITKIIKPSDKSATYQFVRQEVGSGRQAFVICPLIDPSDKIEVQSVQEEYQKLSQEIFPEFKIGFLHGKLKPDDKEKIMKDFLDNKINILVSTSVIEVGIDVPNAAIMMIEGAERFGLAQLHQFRGRVGRSEYQSYCFLFTENNNEKTKARLEALVNSNNSFELAEKDLELRGPGEVYGLKQSGLPSLKIATLSDRAIIKEAKNAVDDIIKLSRQLKEYPDLQAKLETVDSIHLE
jgi:ATP-dependent DNA helicase RecG